MNENLKHFNSGQGDLSQAAELQIIFSSPALLQSLSSENSLLSPHRSGKSSMCTHREMNISLTLSYLTNDHAFSVRASYYVTMTCYRKEL